MSRSSAIVLIAVFALGTGLSAGQASRPAQSEAPADVDVRDGRRLFQQKCAVCHVAATKGQEPYGPKVSKAQVSASEEGVAQIIRDGGARMPGFRYALEPRQIAAIIAFLKTLDVPPERIFTETPSP